MSGEKLGNDEKDVFYDILKIYSKDDLLEKHVNILGREFGTKDGDGRSIPKNIILNLVNDEWTPELKQDLIDDYLKTTYESKPAGGYVLNLNTNVDKSQFIALLTPHLAKITENVEEVGFEIIPNEDPNILNAQYIDYDVTYELSVIGTIVPKTSLRAMYFTVDFDKRKVYFKDTEPSKFLRCYGMLKNKVMIEFEGTYREEDYQMDPERFNGQINVRFMHFVDDLRMLLTVRNSDRLRTRAGNGDFYTNKIEDEDSKFSKFEDRFKRYSPEKKEKYALITKLIETEADFDETEFLEALSQMPLPTGYKSEEFFENAFRVSHIYLDTKMVNENRLRQMNLERIPGINDINKLKLEGSEIFENEMVHYCNTAGGRSLGVGGIIKHGDYDYELDIKYAINFKNSVKPYFIRLNFKGTGTKKRMVKDEQMIEDLQCTYDLVNSLYELTFSDIQ
ncbi:hypothetical protein [Methanococcus maripaludis]|uniref:Uncharacterized protein n=1 Tax=Methanococcus maripaludis TaxID=39152 RepID=A0A7J9PDU7_METMI|nr:hypothetical protein [Methanococcus maripaludis]MBA2860964.1 hypothetical protein [Methanococcus maripaludis]